MAASLAFLMLMLVGFLGVVVLIVLAVGLARRGPAVREERPVLVARFAGIVIGVVAAVAVGGLPSLGRGVMLAPVVFGLSVLGGVILGELVARRPAEAATRTASLAPRRVTDYVPWAYGVSLLLVLVAEVTLLAVTTTTASADDMGRSGRSLIRACDAVMSSGRSPYPGTFYSIPLLVGLAVAVALAVVAAHRAVARPRGAHPTPGDEPLRRRSVEAVAGALGVAISAPAVGVGAVSAMALLGHSCPAVWFRPVGLLALLLAVAALGFCVWSLFVLGLSGTRAPMPAAASGPGVPPQQSAPTP